MFHGHVTSLPDVIAALFQNKIGSGKLMGPKGVSVDRNGHVIVVDNKSCCVFIFQLNGKLVTRFGNRGNGDRQFAGRPGGTACTQFPSTGNKHIHFLFIYLFHVLTWSPVRL